MTEAGMLVVALLLDMGLGEPPAALHPVVWTGRLVAILQRLMPQSKCQQMAYGAMVVAVCLLVVALPAWFVLDRFGQISRPVHFLLGTFLLKSSFSMGGLLEAAERVRRPLGAGRLDEARTKLRNLVSRDTGCLSAPLMVAATVESLAENSSDSFVAPLFYYLLLGVPGAMAYRVINTLDAMIGYHGEHEYLGKAAARLDDLANFMPARLTGLLLVAASQIMNRQGGAAWRIMRRDRGVTESPNAGWPMSAMAGALGVCLEKVDHYRLGDERSPLVPTTILRANALACLSMLMAASICLALLLVKDA